MKILIVGSGMYVTGRNNTGIGTVLSCMAQISKTMQVDLTVVSKGKSVCDDVSQALKRINTAIKSDLKAQTYSLGENYIENLKKICVENAFDCAIVSIPDDLHYEYTKALLEEKIHCLVVKPFTPTVKEALELIEIQHKNNLYGAVEFHKRWDETNLSIKKAIKDNKIGKIDYFTVDYSQKISIPMKTFKQWSEKSNIFQYLGVHYVDLIYFLTGFKPVKALAYGTNGILKDSGINTFDSVHALIEWQNPENISEKFISSFNTNWIDPDCTSAMSDQKYKVIGTKGRIECDQKNRGIELVSETTGIQALNPYFSEYLPDEDGNLQYGGYALKSVGSFVKDVQDITDGKTTPSELENTRPSFKQSQISTAVIEAVNESLKNNSQWAEVKQH